MKGLVYGMDKKIAITADCVCDLSDDMLDELGVRIIYFYISTDNGCFKDMDEITAGNVVEYFARGGKYINTAAPKPEEYEAFFEKVLKDSDEVIHIAITANLSKSYEFAVKAADRFGGKVHIFDTEHLSTGIGHLVIKAVEMVKEGRDVPAILDRLSVLKSKVSTSFITDKVDYLYRNKRVNKATMLLCAGLRIHPVLVIRNGSLKIKHLHIGNYEKCVMRYVRKELKAASRIDKKRVFITHADCPVKLISRVKGIIAEKCPFEETLVTNASATITSNCGANTIGVLYMTE